MAKMSKKKNDKKKKVLLLFVLLLGITIGFAVLSQTLTINGKSKIEANTWDLDPSDDANAIQCPQGEVCTINPQLETPPRDPDDLVPDDGSQQCSDPSDPTTCEDGNGAIVWMDGSDIYFKHILKIPGDTFTFTAKYDNDGTVDAKITSAVASYFGNNGANTTAAQFLDYSVEYDTATATAMGHTAPTVGDVLAAGESMTFKVTVTFKSSVTELPTAAQVAAINEDGNGASSLFTVQFEQA